jgi:hypothetical protein
MKCGSVEGKESSDCWIGGPWSGKRVGGVFETVKKCAETVDTQMNEGVNNSGSAGLSATVSRSAACRGETAALCRDPATRGRSCTEKVWPSRAKTQARRIRGGGLRGSGGEPRPLPRYG